MSKCSIFMESIHLLKSQQINLGFQHVDCTNKLASRLPQWNTGGNMLQNWTDIAVINSHIISLPEFEIKSSNFAFEEFWISSSNDGFQLFIFIQWIR